LGQLLEGSALGIDVAAQSGEQAPHASKFSALTQVAILEDVVLEAVDDITLPRNDAGHDIGKVFNEVDNEPQGAADSQSVAKFHAQLIDDFQRVEAGGDEDIRIEIEMDYPEAIRITVEIKVEITK
jgi:hypothetical protein